MKLRLFFALFALVSCERSATTDGNQPESPPVAPVSEPPDPKAEVKKLPMFAFLPANEAAPFTQVRIVALGLEAAEHRDRKTHFQIGVFDGEGSAGNQTKALEQLKKLKPVAILIEPIQPDERLGAELESFAKEGVIVFILDRAVPLAKSAVVLRDDLEAIADTAANKALGLVTAWKASPEGGSRPPTIMIVGRATPRDDAIRSRFRSGLISAPDVRAETELTCDGTRGDAEKVVNQVLEAGGKPLIVFATSDTMALGVADALDKNSMHGAAAIIGVDGAGGGDGGLIEVRDGTLTATVMRPNLADQAYELAAQLVSGGAAPPPEVVGRPTLVGRDNAAAELKKGNDSIFRILRGK